MKIAFLLGSLTVGGGNYVVVQHALHAQAMGHDVTLVTQSRFSSAGTAWHPGLAQLRLLHLDECGDSRYDIAVATFWKTVLDLHRLNARQYAYFVQSIESRFFDAAQVQRRRLIDSTYDLRLPAITEATWIQNHLARVHGSACLLARNGIRKDLYTEIGARHAPREPGKLRVMVEGGFGVSFKNTARTLRLIRRAKPCQSWLLTSTELAWYPGVDRVFSRVPITEVAAIYRSCDVIVKLSLVEGMFAPPLEMFHCGGTAIVYDVSGHDEYIVNGRNALVAPMHDEAAVLEHLRRLRETPALLAELKAGAAQTAADWPDWPASSALFLEHLQAWQAAPPVGREWLREQTIALCERYSGQLQGVPHAKERAVAARRWMAPVLCLRDSVAPYSRLLRYIAEGYR